MNLKPRVDRLEAKASPEINELDMALWKLHLEEHPDDDPLPPVSQRGLTLERLLLELSDES
jgi:hypothetical protein